MTKSTIKKWMTLKIMLKIISNPSQVLENADFINIIDLWIFTYNNNNNYLNSSYFEKWTQIDEVILY
jgi:hypothetical protein